MTTEYNPSVTVADLAGKLSKAMADCLKEQGAAPSENLEAAMICCGIMAKTSKLVKTSESLFGMAASVGTLRNLTREAPVVVDTPSPIVGTDGRPASA